MPTSASNDMTAITRVMPADMVPFTTSYVAAMTRITDTMVMIAALRIDIPWSTWGCMSCDCSTVVDGSVIDSSGSVHGVLSPQKHHASCRQRLQVEQSLIIVERLRYAVWYKPLFTTESPLESPSIAVS